MTQALGISVSQLIMIFRCTTEPFLLPVFISPVNQLCPMTTHLEEPKKRRIGHWGPITRGRLNPSDFWDPIQCVPSICPFPSDKNYWPNNISSKAGCCWSGLACSFHPFQQSIISRFTVWLERSGMVFEIDPYYLQILNDKIFETLCESPKRCFVNCD